MPIPAEVPRQKVSSKVTPTGFQAKPVNMVARSHSPTAQPPASASTSAIGECRPNRQASPVASAG